MAVWRIPGLYSPMISSVLRWFLLGLLLAAGPSISQATPAPQEAAQTTAQRGGAGTFSRGKKLILKDGTYQVAREYERNGERVRYFSLERGEWEEFPAALGEWAATAKAEAANERAAAGVIDKAHKQEEAKRLDNVADIDASLQVGEGVFLPPGEGMFVVEAKSIRLLEQAGSAVKID